MRPKSSSILSASITDESIPLSRYDTPYSDIQIMNLEDSMLDLDRIGLTLWKIEDNKLVTVEEDDYGFFHEGTVYIVLYVNDERSKYLHLWRGRLALELDKSNGHDKIHEVDEQLGGAHVLSCQYQGYESSCFTSLFSEGIVYVEGSAKTITRKASKYYKRLYKISDTDCIRAHCVEPIIEELSSTGAVVLDGFPRVYIWFGDQCPFSTRIKVIDLVRKMRQYQRKDKLHIVVIDSSDEEAEKSFKKKLGSKLQPPPQAIEKQGQSFRKKPVLHRLSGEKVLYDMPVVTSKPLKHKYLIKRDSYLLDSGSDKPIYVWVGHQAASSDLAEAVFRGMMFSNFHDYPSVNSVCRVREGWETDEFKQSFIDWQESIVRYKNRSKSRPSTCVSTGRLRTARSDRLSYDVCYDIVYGNDNYDDIVDSNGETLIWYIKDNDLTVVPWDRHGIFSNGLCYIILHQTIKDAVFKRVLYYWLGANSTAIDQTSTVQLTQSMNKSLNSTATVIRILDGHESLHFLTVLQHSMIVYESRLKRSENDEQMFIVTELENGSMKVAQVSPCTEYLTSSIVVLYLSDVDCILWYGEHTGGSQREYSKTILSFLLPTRKYTFDVLLEGKETEYFWSLLKNKKIAKHERNIEKYERRQPHLLQLILDGFKEITSFVQLDLTDDGIYIVDYFNQILVWYGKLCRQDDKDKIPNILISYIKSDLAGRKEENIEIWFINQYSEPCTFIQAFPYWSESGYGSQENYELARKKVRQENAIVHIHVDIDDLEHTKKSKYDPFLLRKPELPDDVDPYNKQDHLSDCDFIEVYKLPRSQFYRLPSWKQGQIIKSAKLTSS